MSVAFVKAAELISGGTVLTFSPTNAGDLLIVTSDTSAGGGNPTATITDNLSNSWTTVIATTDVSSQYVSAFALANIPAGITSVTLSYNGGTPGQVYVTITEISGAAATSPVIAQVVGASSSAATDGITSGTTAVSTVPAYLLGVTTASAQWSSLTAGTGYTQRFVGSYQNMIEDRTVSSSGSYAATFTDASHGSATSYWTFMFAIVGASAPSGNKSGFFFGGLAPVVPLAWAIERRRRRARERLDGDQKSGTLPSRP